MVRIFKDNKTGDYIIQTTCLMPDDFVSELSEALTKSIDGDESGAVVLGILTNALPIAYKLSGYKADTVSEQRTLVCGNMSPDSCEVIATAGK